MASIRNRVIIPIGHDHQHQAEFVSFNGLSDGKEHIALVFKQADQGTKPLVRLHSECLTGDVFHSARCDCGQQLDEAIDLMAEQGGILLYMRQEGRGIGLFNKLDAYSLQDQGLDTYAANKALGFEHDLRDFSVAADMLKAIGIDLIELLTNNPEKVQVMESHGIDVANRRSTGVFENQHNSAYLEAKRKIAQHHIDLPNGEGNANTE